MGKVTIEITGGIKIHTGINKYTTYKVKHCCNNPHIYYEVEANTGPYTQGRIECRACDRFVTTNSFINTDSELLKAWNSKG